MRKSLSRQHASRNGRIGSATNRPVFQDFSANRDCQIAAAAPFPGKKMPAITVSQKSQLHPLCIFTFLS